MDPKQTDFPQYHCVYRLFPEIIKRKNHLYEKDVAGKLHLARVFLAGDSLTNAGLCADRDGYYGERRVGTVIGRRFTKIANKPVCVMSLPGQNIESVLCGILKEVRESFDVTNPARPDPLPPPSSERKKLILLAGTNDLTAAGYNTKNDYSEAKWKALELKIPDFIAAFRTTLIEWIDWLNVWYAPIFLYNIPGCSGYPVSRMARDALNAELEKFANERRWIFIKSETKLRDDGLHIDERDPEFLIGLNRAVLAERERKRGEEATSSEKMLPVSHDPPPTTSAPESSVMQVTAGTPPMFPTPSSTPTPSPTFLLHTQPSDLPQPAPSTSNPSGSNPSAPPASRTTAFEDLPRVQQRKKEADKAAWKKKKTGLQASARKNKPRKKKK